ncbi:BQ2448_5807 [Microbotryum intermedium]|uniref:BQ2448_5807 protein n=1 Tax=Microbotryum intermedium TaxID=269621 RepID=A0A238F5D4_9BASI|nr:BQ2448_5807 [Microbotryum intermedium]
MLPWNPPSSFSSQNEQTHTFRGSYGTQQQQHLQQQQQQQHDDPPQLQPQQPPQQQQQQQPPPAPAPMQPPPMTLASTLHFLQSEHRRYAKDRNEWEIERAEMRARIALLEGEKRGNEGALRDLARRCKMLENALRGERSKFLSSTNAAPGASTPSNASGTASPVPGSVPGGLSAAKAAHQLSNLNPASAPKDKGEPSAGAKEGSTPESAPMASSTSSAGPANAVTASASGATTTAAAPRAANAGTNGVAPAGAAGTGNWGTTGLGAAARDPRGKARSRDYLKQCLQEIHYLTSATTMNPLSSTSFAAPSVPRPRKTLPEHVPPSGPGVYSISLPPSASTAAVPPSSSLAAASNAPTIEATTQLRPTHVASLAPHPVTQFPSDPPSAFVPLKRTISQPGGAGMPPVSASMESDNQINMRNIRDTTPRASIPMVTSAPSTTLLDESTTKSDPNGALLPSLGKEAVTMNDDEQVDEGIVKPPSPPLEVPLSPVNKATTTVSGSPKLEYTPASTVSDEVNGVQHGTTTD